MPLTLSKTISFWRPFNDVVRNTPLLFCDRRTVPAEDLIEVDKVLPDKVEKSWFMFYRGYHRWYTLAGQRSDEVAVFPTWTSEPMGPFASMLCSFNRATSCVMQPLTRISLPPHIRLLPARCWCFTN